MPESSPRVPLYHRLTQELIDKIRSGAWAVDVRMPTERELCVLFGVSRITVRQALDELEREGWIVRRQGNGTYPRTPPIVQRLQDFYSFSEEIRKLGLTPSVILLEFDRIPCPEAAVGPLRVETGTPVHRIHRLRLADGEPFALETSFIPVLLCPGLSSALVVAQGLYRAIVSMSGIEVAEAVETFEATVADRDVAKALHMRPGEAAMHLVRTAGTRTGQPVEYCDTLIRGDRYRFRVTLK